MSAEEVKIDKKPYVVRGLFQRSFLGLQEAFFVHVPTTKSRFSTGPLTAVSKPIFASKYSFYSIFRDLQVLHSFAPLRIQKSSKILSTIFGFFQFFFVKILHFFLRISSIFASNLMKFYRNFDDFLQKLSKSMELSKISENPGKCGRN